MNLVTEKEFVDDFKHVHFVIYGASGGGKKCYDYLRTLNLENQLDCFVDRDEQKWTKTLHGRKICNPLYLKEHPEFVVVIGSQSYREIKNGLLNDSINNRIYGYIDFDPV
jgi:hypothetical protein